MTVANVADLVPLNMRITGDDTEGPKPQPAPIRAALARLGVGARETVMIGDTPYDIEAGHKAGVATIAVRSGGWA